MTQKQTQEVTLLNPDDNAIVAMDKLAAEYALIRPEEAKQFSTSIKQANGIILLKNALTPEIMKPIMALQGSSLGFRTDKDKDGGYPEPVVQECVIEATMRGLPILGNQFNIISARCYITKEGFGTLLAKIPGLRYMITPGIPKMTSSGAEAPVHVEWKYNGESNSKDLTFPIRVNSGMGADAINGKATRKARAWLYMQVTGMEVNDGEVGEEGSFNAPIEATKQGRFAKKAPIDVTPKAPAAEAAPIDAEATASVTIESTATQTAEEKYPRLAKMVAERPQYGVTVQDFLDWHESQKWAFNEENCLKQIESACAQCAEWKNSHF